MTTRGWIRYPLAQRDLIGQEELDVLAKRNAAEMGGRVLKAHGEQIIAGRPYYCYRIEKLEETGDES